MKRLLLVGVLGAAGFPWAAAWMEYVEPRIGTANATTPSAGLFGKGSEEMGQTLPAVLEPHGMNFWTPQTRPTERKCVAPYYYADTLFQGFRNSHWIVGGCTQDYGSFTVTPQWGTLRTSTSSAGSRFNHNGGETSTPALYSVGLPDEALKAELTATSRAALMRFNYQLPGKAYVVVRPNSDEGLGEVEIDTLTWEISGRNPVHRIYQGKGREAGFSGWFVLQSQLRPSAFGVFVGDSIFPGQTEVKRRPDVGAYFEYDLPGGGNDTVMVKAGSSFVDIAGAQNNMQAKIPHWNFDLTRQQLIERWEQELGQIEVEAPDTNDLTNFYSALYRTAFLPRAFSDADGRYPSFAGGEKIMTMPEGQTYYEDFSLWDTYRAEHPLLVLLHPRQSGQMMQSLVVKAQQGGWLPIFPCWNSYTAAMIGDHATAALADAYIKGVRNFDARAAYRFMLRNATTSPKDTADYCDGKGRRALNSYLRHGYIPLQDTVAHAYHKREQTSRTLEYAFDDFALSQMAEALGRRSDAEKLAERSLWYRNVIDPATGYASGRNADGRFVANANPFNSATYITEGAPCHYTWYAPHDPSGLVELLGGKEKFAAELDSMFTCRRYWHGNEPCHQVAYMFNFAHRPDLTQRRVSEVRRSEYQPLPGGLSGNDDAGQMSAWYVFSALGFYPVCPAKAEYQIGSPLFRRATIHLENGRDFTIEAPEVSPRNVYIQDAWLNGEPFQLSTLTHQTLLEGGTLRLEMGPNPKLP